MALVIFNKGPLTAKTSDKATCLATQQTKGTGLGTRGAYAALFRLYSEDMTSRDTINAVDTCQGY